MRGHAMRPDGSSSPLAATGTIEGTLLTEALLGIGGNQSAVCEPPPFNFDIQPRSEVRVRDKDGSLIGTGVLSTPPDNPSAYSPDRETCIYAFTIADVAAEFYTFEIGERDAQATHAMSLKGLTGPSCSPSRQHPPLRAKLPSGCLMMEAHRRARWGERRRESSPPPSPHQLRVFANTRVHSELDGRLLADSWPG